MKHPALDAHRVGPKLWIGSDPPRGLILNACGFRTVVLCAMEHQLPPTAFPGVRVLHAPMDDCAYVPVEMARLAGNRAARLARNGERVLVACHMGRNRSGLVVALALRELTGWPGKKCVEHVQAIRPETLTNEEFSEFLRSLPSKRYVSSESRV